MKKFENIYKADKLEVLEEALKGLEEVKHYISSTFEFNLASTLCDVKSDLIKLINKIAEERGEE